MVKIEINGQVVEAKEGSMLIDVADQANIAIPRFCYHKKLSIAANCRMCLVEVEGAPKAMPACATPVTDGMKVLTQSQKAKGAQKNVMEFLLINHPLDCPICDQGGECELQDVALEYGDDVSHFNEGKRVVADKDIGSLIQTDMTRCIHCTRCVRFGQEVAGMMELGATGRSEWMEIGTYIEKSVSSEMSGNMIDLCPVGALTSKPFRYSARPWELQSHPTIAPHDSIGSNIVIHAKGNEVKRVVPAENESVNEVWISDRDRFSYEAIHSEDRLQTPMIKNKGQWQDVDWETALAFVADKLKAYAETSPDQVGVLAAPNATLEELHLLQKMARGLGIENLDHRLRQSDFRLDSVQPHSEKAVQPHLNLSFDGLENQEVVLLVGSWLRKEIPLLNHRLRKAGQKGAGIWAINPETFDFNYEMTQIASDQWLLKLAGLVKTVAEKTGHQSELPQWVAQSEVDTEVESLAQQMIESKNVSVMLGQIAQTDAHYTELVQLSACLEAWTDANLSIVPLSANTVGAQQVGFLPFKGKNAEQMLSSRTRMYLNFGLEPEKDLADGQLALNAMRQAEFVVNMTAFDSETQRDYADVLLPIGTFAETAGSFVNAMGRLQSFKMAIEPVNDAKPGWKVFRVLGNLLGLDGFDQTNAAQVRSDIALTPLSPDFQSLEAAKAPEQSAIVTTEQVNIYAVDAMVRRSPSLQATPDAKSA
ncbi:MAG: NADH-quinone oxidoreductase subunit NuoG [Hydrogenovibrio sp.]|uniref:NADH-quinone oxidoreductase subunit NuoG n=1 Tax=Hydrogenovibrio sp. TaxID=2065821 RepID=UPI00287025DC|nr:NADH-quinone oxidoreductase subunit NuoG [Hydrogenovibrio sp.]MDR9499431.1 NADH-quinone oxidoreductase subunit NuoG [Hydrogenovibrio sp.]